MSEVILAGVREGGASGSFKKPRNRGIEMLGQPSDVPRKPHDRNAGARERGGRALRLPGRQGDGGAGDKRKKEASPRNKGSGQSGCVSFYSEPLHLLLEKFSLLLMLGWLAVLVALAELGALVVLGDQDHLDRCR